MRPEFDNFSDDQKPKTVLFGDDATQSIAKKMNRDYDAEETSALLQGFLRQSQSAELVQRNAKFFPFVPFFA